MQNIRSGLSRHAAFIFLKAKALFSAPPARHLLSCWTCVVRATGVGQGLGQTVLGCPVCWKCYSIHIIEPSTDVWFICYEFGALEIVNELCVRAFQY